MIVEVASGFILALPKQFPARLRGDEMGGPKATQNYDPFGMEERTPSADSEFFIAKYA